MMDELAKSEQDVTEWVKKSKSIDSVHRIPGDASSRRYYRVHANDKTYIVMRMDPFEKEGLKLPFLVVQKLLAMNGVDVPAIIDVDPGRGFVLLEDLGDVTLLRRLQDVSNPDVERHLYTRSIDALVNLQIKTHPKRISKEDALEVDGYQLRFDHEKLLWELNNTIEHFYEVHLKRSISSEDRKIMQSDFSDICTVLANEPTVFCHRDYHSRNLMVLPKDRLVMIDFQDARMGPAQYDLASLLRDSYYQLEEAQIDRLIDYYMVKWEAASGKNLDRNYFRYIFDLMSVQRNFKAIGSFASFSNRRGDPTYLKYIGNTFENIRRNLLKYPQYSKLREVLFHYYYF